MTPTFLSEYIGSYLMKAATLVATTQPPERYTVHNYTETTHEFTLSSNTNGEQVLQAIQNNLSQYQIYFAGNIQDALHPQLVQDVLQKTPNKNHIFWDYPGATRYIGVNRFEQLFQAGYTQVKALLESGIADKDITIYGYSMGGGIAAHITRQLHREGHLVNVTIDRSFSSLCAVISPLLYQLVTQKSLLNKKYARHLPLGTSIAAFSVMGVSLGTTVASLIASIGKPFKRFSSGFNWIASITGGLVAFAGFITGTLIGTVVGACLSLQLIFTNHPRALSLKLPTRILLNTTTGEMTSVKNMLAILNLKKHGQIKIINSKSDEVIHVTAALNTGLGFTTCSNRTVKPYQLTSIWYQEGNHYALLQAHQIDHNLTH